MSLRIVSWFQPKILILSELKTYLIEDHKFKLEFEDVAEYLNRVAEAKLIEIDEEQVQDVKRYTNDIDVDEIHHHSSLSQ